MSSSLEKELLEVAQWYTYHKGEPMDVERRIEFLTKTCDFLIWTMARMVEDLRLLEGRKRNGNGYDPYITLAVPNSLRTPT